LALRQAEHTRLYLLGNIYLPQRDALTAALIFSLCPVGIAPGDHTCK